jgi:valyl-tRNA synthetase
MNIDPKKAREQEKERKKADKLKKLEDKKAKQTTAKQVDAQQKPKTKALAEVPAYVDVTPEGQKKIQLPLTDERLKAYNPTVVESAHYFWWEKMDFFKPKHAADQDTNSEEPFTIIEPPPNVTGLLHMGHALSGTLQDVMIR